MNKAVKNRRRENLFAERLGRDSNQMGRPFLGEPMKHEPGMNRQKASLYRMSINQALRWPSDQENLVRISGCSGSPMQQTR